jgi:hypothetical protein
MIAQIQNVIVSEQIGESNITKKIVKNRNVVRFHPNPAPCTVERVAT